MLVLTALLALATALPTNAAPRYLAITSRVAMIHTSTGHDSTDLATRLAALRALMAVAPERLPNVLAQLKRRTDHDAAVLRLEFLTQAGYRQPNNPPGDARADRFQFARDLAATDPDSAVRKQAIAMLRGDMSDEAAHALGQAARNAPTVALRQAAVMMLASINTQRAQNEMRAIYPSLTEPSMKVMAINMVARNDSASWPWLLEIVGAENEPYEIRRRALECALANANARRETTMSLPTVQALSAIYKRLGDSSLRMQIVEALARRDDDAAIEELGRIAKNDPDHSLRQRAVMGLRASHRERAAHLLSEIIVQ